MYAADEVTVDMESEKDCFARLSDIILIQEAEQLVLKAFYCEEV